MPELAPAPEPAAVGAPFPCPNCGESNWKADYYQAVSQGVALYVDENGSFEYGDYLGDEDSYDDGSTEDEALRCRSCDHHLVLGVFRLIPEGALAQHHELAGRLDALVSAFREGNQVEDVLATLEACAEALRLDAALPPEPGLAAAP